jgi:hypothetical protein
LTATNLATAIEKHIAIRLENGSRVKQPRMEGYTLFVSPGKELAARVILNDNSKFAGTGTNANLGNQFMFEGSKVNLEVMDKLADYDKNGTIIGSATQWFLVNMPALKEAEALKFIRLCSPLVKQYINNETDQSIVDVRNGYAVDHFGAEYFIVGSNG